MENLIDKEILDKIEWVAITPEFSLKKRQYQWHEKVLINFNTRTNEYKELKRICKELDLRIYQMDCSSDIAAYPYFLLVLNPDNFSQDDSDILHDMLKVYDDKEISVLFTKQPKFKLTTKLKKFTIKQPRVFNYDNLKLIILNKRNALLRRGKKKISYDKKLYRMLYIMLNLMDKSKHIATQDLCNEFHVSEKTVQRDIDMLRILGNDINFNKKSNEWELGFSKYLFDLTYYTNDSLTNK